MRQFNVHEAKTNFSRLLAMVENGERVIIARHREPVAELVPFQRKRLILGSGKDDPNVDRNALAGNWWRAMSDEEADDFYEGR